METQKRVKIHSTGNTNTRKNTKNWKHKHASKYIELETQTRVKIYRTGNTNTRQNT